MHVHPVVIITTPPENTTVCSGSDVTISCGHTIATVLPVTWIINGTSFTLEEIPNSPLYQLNNPFGPPTLSLTVFSINGTTTFQCVVLSTIAMKLSSTPRYRFYNNGGCSSSWVFLD